MSLKVDYNVLTDGIVNYLAANSSTVNSSLTAAVQFIGTMRPSEYHLYGAKLPAISVDLVSHGEEINEFAGNPAVGREVTLTYEIGLHTRMFNSYTALLMETRQFVTNVEFALRNDPELSSTFDLAQIQSCEFGNTIEGNKGVKQRNAKITLIATYFAR